MDTEGGGLEIPVHYPEDVSCQLHARSKGILKIKLVNGHHGPDTSDHCPVTQMMLDGSCKISITKSLQKRIFKIMFK